MSKEKYKIKIVFFGTPDYVIPVVDRISRSFRGTAELSPIEAVITQKPKPVGREQKLTYSPVDNWAYKKNIKIFRDLDEFHKHGTEAKLGVLSSYGEMIPEKVIKMFPFGIVNIHPSLLPVWRGAAPVQASIISGEAAGISVIKMDTKLDHGPLISNLREQIASNDTTDTLRQRLYEKSADFLVEMIPSYIAGKIKLKPQDHSKAKFTRELTKDDAFIPPQFLDSAMQGKPATEEMVLGFMDDYRLKASPNNLDRFIRAMHSWPGAWTHVQLSPDQEPVRIKIIEAHVEIEPRIELFLDKVQLAGKNIVSYREMLLGYPNHRFRD